MPIIFSPIDNPVVWGPPKRRGPHSYYNCDSLKPALLVPLLRVRFFLRSSSIKWLHVWEIMAACPSANFFCVTSEWNSVTLGIYSLKFCLTLYWTSTKLAVRETEAKFNWFINKSLMAKGKLHWIKYVLFKVHVFYLKHFSISSVFNTIQMKVMQCNACCT
jgi:hypothetical protein